MNSVSKNVYIDKLDDILKRYNNAYHNTIKIQPVDVKWSTYIDSRKEINEKVPKLRIGDIIRMAKYKNIFAKGYTPNWSEKVFVIKKLKTLCRGHMLLMILLIKKLLEHFTKNNFKNQIKKSLELNLVNYMLNGKDIITWLIAG